MIPKFCNINFENFFIFFNFISEVTESEILNNVLFKDYKKGKNYYFFTCLWIKCGIIYPLALAHCVSNKLILQSSVHRIFLHFYSSLDPFYEIWLLANFKLLFNWWGRCKGTVVAILPGRFAPCKRFRMFLGENLLLISQTICLKDMLHFSRPSSHFCDLRTLRTKHFDYNFLASRLSSNEQCFRRSILYKLYNVKKVLRYFRKLVFGSA